MYLCYVVPCHAMKRMSSLPVFFLSGTLFNSGSLPAARFYAVPKRTGNSTNGDPIWTTRKSFLGKNKIKKSFVIYYPLPSEQPRKSPFSWKRKIKNHLLSIQTHLPTNPTHPPTHLPDSPLLCLVPGTPARQPARSELFLAFDPTYLLLPV
jgi:hypothetical protein